MPSMRPAQLRALLKELRAGGVSEYSTTDRRGCATTLKLAGPFQSAQAQPSKRATVKDAEPPISSAMRKQLEDLGVDVDQAREVLASVGIGGSADGN